MSGTFEGARSTPDIESVEGVTRGFLFADLRGYTEYVERHGGEAAARLLGRYRALVRAQVARLRGAEIKTEGDSFYVVFSSASAAVRAGLAILEVAAQENASRTDDPLRVGIGVHAGETVETTEGYVGSPVNIAARLCAQAEAGELLVSDTVRALTSTVVRARFIPRGRRTLKGIAEPMQVFGVMDAARVEGRTPPPGTRPPVLAVGAAAVGGVVVIAVISALVLGGRSASPSQVASSGLATTTAASPSPTPAVPSPTTSASVIDRRERDLFEAIPAEIVERCALAPEEAIHRATVTARCELPIRSGADTVWWHYLETEGETDLALDRIAVAQNVPDVECGPDAPEGRGEWSLGRTFTGERTCYLDDERRAWVAWTYRDEQILARAVRIDGDAFALDAWWTDIAPFAGS